ncbi:hypothetical protein ACA910_007010 [Epithemia clementina (nom. ined.)]
MSSELPQNPDHDDDKNNNKKKKKKNHVGPANCRVNLLSKNDDHHDSNRENRDDDPSNHLVQMVDRSSSSSLTKEEILTLNPHAQFGPAVIQEDAPYCPTLPVMPASPCRSSKKTAALRHLTACITLPRTSKFFCLCII